MIRGPMAKIQSLIVRLLNTPDLAAIVPRLQPEIVHRVIQACGLEDCAELVALATPAQLAQVLDHDIWRVRARGGDEEFDPERFGLWIAVLMQTGPVVAAEKVMGLDADLVIEGFARHVAVFDFAAVAPYTTLDGDEILGRDMHRGRVCEVGGYVIQARRESAFEPLVDLLSFLSSEHGSYFARLMRGCVRLSNGAREEDGFHTLLEDDEQHAFDVAYEREARREAQGYVTPAQAQAFLRGARDVRLDDNNPLRNDAARAYFRALETTPPADAAAGESRTESAEDGGAASEPNGVAAVVELLREAGVIASAPRALLVAADSRSSRLSWIEAHAADYPTSAEELAYLANVLIAGCSVQGRTFTPREASDAAVAVCNLGLQNWPSHWPEGNLIAAFQVGWTILHRDVCMYAAKQLEAILADLRCTDRDIQLRVEGLRRELARHAAVGEPWRARGSLDAIIMLDTTCWAVLAALVDECPVAHAALDASRTRARRISPSDFEFIAENAQIEAIREFMASLPSMLIG